VSGGNYYVRLIEQKRTELIIVALNAEEAIEHAKRRVNVRNKLVHENEVLCEEVSDADPENIVLPRAPDKG
jgi:hypothetical protein